MRNRRPWLPALLALLLPLCAPKEQAKEPPKQSGGAPAPPSIPTEVNVDLNLGYGGNIVAEDQVKFDEFSWQTFVAINQPAPQARALADGDSVPRVWETWADANDFFGNTIPTQCGDSTRSGAKVLRMMSKNSHVPNTNDEFIEATGQPLIDQNRNFVLYEIRINPDEAKYLKAKKLNTLGGQHAYQQSGQQIDLPAGPTPEWGPHGAMEVKAAWRILKAGHPANAAYYTRVGTIYISGENTDTGAPLCIDNTTLGLVGLHVIHKTKKFVRWVWSTFEHNANTPNAQNQKSSFFDPNCGDCPVNVHPKPPYKWATTQPYAAAYGAHGTQVLAANQIYPHTDAVTVRWWATPWVQGTVWANYHLIGSQWSASADAGFVGVPNYLANTTMETYIQPVSSCVICHAQARDTVGQCSDFSFALHIVPKLGAQGQPAPKALIKKGDLCAQTELKR